MATPDILILDTNDRQLYQMAIQKLTRIDTEICRQRKSFWINHKSHIQTALHFIVMELLAIELQAKDVKDKNLRIELRKDIVRRKQRYYELYDEVQDTIFLNYNVPLAEQR